jgi:hypothetical protein
VPPAYRMGGMVSDRQWSDIPGVASRADLDWIYLREWAPRRGVADLPDQLLAEVSRIRPA